MARIIPPSNNAKFSVPSWMNPKELVSSGKGEIQNRNARQKMQKTASKDMIVTSYGCASCRKTFSVDHPDLKAQANLSARAGQLHDPICPKCGSTLAPYDQIEKLARVDEMRTGNLVEKRLDLTRQEMEPISKTAGIQDNTAVGTGTYNTFTDRHIVYKTLEALAAYASKMGMFGAEVNYVQSSHTKQAGQEYPMLNSMECAINWRFGKKSKATVYASIGFDAAGKYQFPTVFHTASGRELPFTKDVISRLENDKEFDHFVDRKTRSTDTPTYRRPDITNFRAVASQNDNGNSDLVDELTTATLKKKSDLSDASPEDVKKKSLDAVAAGPSIKVGTKVTCIASPESLGAFFDQYWHDQRKPQDEMDAQRHAFEQLNGKEGYVTKVEDAFLKGTSRIFVDFGSSTLGVVSFPGDWNHFLKAEITPNAVTENEPQTQTQPQTQVQPNRNNGVAQQPSMYPAGVQHASLEQKFLKEALLGDDTEMLDDAADPYPRFVSFLNILKRKYTTKTPMTAHKLVYAVSQESGRELSHLIATHGEAMWKAVLEVFPEIDINEVKQQQIPEFIRSWSALRAVADGPQMPQMPQAPTTPTAPGAPFQPNQKVVNPNDGKEYVVNKTTPNMGVTVTDPATNQQSIVPQNQVQNLKPAVTTTANLKSKSAEEAVSDNTQFYPSAIKQYARVTTMSPRWNEIRKGLKTRDNTAPVDPNSRQAVAAKSLGFSPESTAKDKTGHTSVNNVPHTEDKEITISQTEFPKDQKATRGEGKGYEIPFEEMDRNFEKDHEHFDNENLLPAARMTRKEVGERVKGKDDKDYGLSTFEKESLLKAVGLSAVAADDAEATPEGIKKLPVQYKKPPTKPKKEFLDEPAVIPEASGRAREMITKLKQTQDDLVALKAELDALIKPHKDAIDNVTKPYQETINKIQTEKGGDIKSKESEEKRYIELIHEKLILGEYKVVHLNNQITAATENETTQTQSVSLAALLKKAEALEPELAVKIKELKKIIEDEGGKDVLERTVYQYPVSGAQEGKLAALEGEDQESDTLVGKLQAWLQSFDSTLSLA